MKQERTIDTTGVLFKGKAYSTVVDVPGHKEFIKNLLTAASNAQIAVLVLSAPDLMTGNIGKSFSPLK